MKVRLIATAMLVWVLSGCAKFPATSAGGYTRLAFRFNLNGPVNPNYIYFVAIRVVSPGVGSDTTLSDTSQYQPSPVVDVGSKNGIVGGLPTHYIIYSPTDPNLYQVYRFPTKAEEGSSADPTDPAAIDLRFPGQLVGDVLPGSGINPQNSDGSYGNSLGFDIDTSYLDQRLNNIVGGTVAAGQSIKVIQFNIFTMNVQALTSGEVAERVMDAIGNQSNVSNQTFSNAIQVNLGGGNTYTDQSSSVPETVGDTFPSGSNLPSVDLTSWSLQVSTP